MEAERPLQADGSRTNPFGRAPGTQVRPVRYRPWR